MGADGILSVHTFCYNCICCFSLRSCYGGTTFLEQSNFLPLNHIYYSKTLTPKRHQNIGFNVVLKPP